MNEVNMLNIGGVDYNIDDQHVRDLIAHSENGLDSQSNLPISSRHYDEGEYLIGQDRYYYEATTDIDPGDVLAEGTNLRKTLLSDEIVSLKNQSSIAVIQCIAKRETGALATSSYPIIGSYLYWDYGLTAGLYETIAAITAGDALTIGVNLKSASKIADTMDGLQDAYNITGAKNLCPNEASDTTTTDITWDVLSDGSIQVSGTPASTRTLVICEGGVVLPAGTYTLTTGTDRVCLQAKNKANGTILGRSNGYEYPATFTISSATTVTFLLYTIGGTSSMNVRAYPMCRVASITDGTYVPFAMTNKQLTDRIGNIKRKLLLNTPVTPSQTSRWYYSSVITDLLDYDFVLVSGKVGNGRYSIVWDLALGSETFSISDWAISSYYTDGNTIIDCNNKKFGVKTNYVSGWDASVCTIERVVGYKLY